VLEFTNSTGQKFEGTVIEGFNTRLRKKIASFEWSHHGVRQQLFRCRESVAERSHRSQLTSGTHTPSLPRSSTIPRSTDSQIPHPTVQIRTSGVTTTTRHVRIRRFVSFPVSPADCGSKLLPGSPRTGPYRRGDRKEGFEVDHLVNVGHRFRAELQFPPLATDASIWVLWDLKVYSSVCKNADPFEWRTFWVHVAE
jgi:hypothetical protein